MFRLLPVLALIAAPAMANDSAGGLDNTGLFFTQTDQVAMASEDLYIGLEKITVDYVFENTSTRDFTTEVIFPMPPISLDDLGNSDFNLPYDRGQPNLLNFTATVDGQPVQVTQDRIAVMAPGWSEDRPLAQQYDTPGRDVTALLRKAGITDLSLDVDAVAQALMALPRAQRLALRDEGVIWTDQDGANPLPQWSVILRYHWTQTFPAGKDLRISHGYDNRPTLGFYGWQHALRSSPDISDTQRFCIDDGTSRAMERALRVLDANGEPANFGYAAYTNYVLRTANSWSGPIGTFRLTLDKGQPENIISLCIDGVNKTGPTTFVVEKTDFIPDRDLEILVVIPTANIMKNRLEE